MAGFVDVLLRGLALCGQAVAIGGVLFAVLLLRPSLVERGPARARLTRSLWLTGMGAAVVAGAQMLSLGVQLSVLGDGAGGWPISEVAGTTFFRAGVVRILACAGLVAGCVALVRRPEPLRWWIALEFFAVRRLPAGAATSRCRGCGASSKSSSVWARRCCSSPRR